MPATATPLSIRFANLTVGYGSHVVLRGINATLPEALLDMTRGESKVAGLINFLEQRDIAIGEMSLRQPTLNDVFLEVTGKELRDSV